MQKVILFGATGQQGSAIAQKLIKSEYQVISPVRSVEKRQLLYEQGIEGIVSDFTEQSLTNIVALADKVVLTVPVVISPTEMIAYTKNALNAIKANGSPHTVFSISSIIPTENVGLAGPDARLEMKQLAQKTLPQSIILSSTLYLENFSQAYRQAIEQGGVIPQALSADIPVSYLSFDDLATLVCAALDKPELNGQFIPIGGSESLTGNMLAEKLSVLLNKQISYQAITPQDLSNFLTPLIGEITAKQVAEMYSWEGTTGKHLLSPSVEKYEQLLGVKLPSFDEWAIKAFQISIK